jgi:hypothetical protein
MGLYELAWLPEYVLVPEHPDVAKAPTTAAIKNILIILLPIPLKPYSS